MHTAGSVDLYSILTSKGFYGGQVVQVIGSVCSTTMIATITHQNMTTQKINSSSYTVLQSSRDGLKYKIISPVHQITNAKVTATKKCREVATPNIEMSAKVIFSCLWSS